MEMKNHLIHARSTRNRRDTRFLVHREEGFSGDGGPTAKAALRQPPAHQRRSMRRQCYIADIFNHHVTAGSTRRATSERSLAPSGSCPKEGGDWLPKPKVPGPDRFLCKGIRCGSVFMKTECLDARSQDSRRWRLAASPGPAEGSLATEDDWSRHV